MSSPMKVLIGYNGSPQSNIILQDLQQAGLPEQVDAVVLTVADALLLAEGRAQIMLGEAKAQISAMDACTMATEMLEEASVVADGGRQLVQAAFPTWHVEAQVTAGLPEWDIFWKSEELQSDLLIVGDNRHPSRSPLHVGNASQMLLAQAFCSVRVARPHAPDQPYALRILVGLDGSKGAEEAVKVVAQRRWPAGSHIRLVVGLKPVRTAMLASTLLTREASVEGLDKASQIKANRAQAEAVAQRGLATIALYNPGLDLSVLIKSGDPKNILLKEAEQWRADCIFLGAKGASHSARPTLGTVASAVATRAKCSVEIVRSRG